MLKLVKKYEQNKRITLLLAMQRNIYIRLTLRHRQKLKILMNGRKDKPLHGRYAICASDPDINSG